jgi:hypothetical protein
MATMNDAALTGTPEGWTAFLKAVRENFPGPNNKGLRAEIRRLADSGCELSGLKGTVALTASGRLGIDDCDRALANWDGRAARGQHDAMRRTGSI